MKSKAVLIANKHLSVDKQNQLEDLMFRIEAVMNAKGKKYVMLNAPNDERLKEIVALLPANESPTIMALEDNKWKAIHTVMTESDFWKVVRPLEQLGARGILTTNIEKISPQEG